MVLSLHLQLLLPVKFYLYLVELTINTPLGIVAPKRLNFEGSFKKSTISHNFLLCFITASDIGKSHFNLVFCQHFCF